LLAVGKGVDERLTVAQGVRRGLADVIGLCDGDSEGVSEREREPLPEAQPVAVMLPLMHALEQPEGVRRALPE
jgi:hypothetical protein